MVEARYPSKMTPTSMLNIYEVFHNIHVLWMCIWMSPYHMLLLVSPKRPLEVAQNSGYYLSRGYQQCSEDVEAVDPSKMAPILLSNTYEMCHNLHMLWMSIWMSP